MQNKTIAIILASFGFFTVAISIGVYILNFYSYQISGNPKDWADLGGYLGGVVSSVVSMLALCGVAIGIIEQNKSNKLLVSQSLVETIRNFEYDIDTSLKSHHVNLVIEDKGIEINIYDLLMTARLTHILPEVIPVYKDSLKRIVDEKISILDWKISLEELLSRTASRLKMLAPLIEQHEALSGQSAIAVYYRSKYKDLFKKLHQFGYDAGEEF